MLKMNRSNEDVFEQTAMLRFPSFAYPTFSPIFHPMKITNYAPLPKSVASIVIKHTLECILGSRFVAHHILCVPTALSNYTEKLLF